MHDKLSRAEQHQKSRRSSPATAFLLITGMAAYGFAGGQLLHLSSTHSHAAKNTSLSAIDLDAPAQKKSQKRARLVPYEVSIQHISTGDEGLNLAARLHKDGGLIIRPIKWKVEKIDATQSTFDNRIFDNAVNEARIYKGAGTYKITAQYGLRHFQQTVNVANGQFLSLVFILDVGGIRAQSSLVGVDLPPTISAIHAIEPLNGPDKGREIKKDAGQGEILRVEAGAYVVKSRLLPGNTIATANVKVKPGILSSLKLKTNAGLLNVRKKPGRSAESTWIIRHATSGWWHQSAAHLGDLVLAPGDYELLHQKGEKRLLVKKFKIKAGHKKELGF